MDNNQYKGFAYTKVSDKPTVVYGTSAQDILAKLNSYNIARTENDKFMACNIGSLNAEANKYENYHRYEVATGKDISAIYLQIPSLPDSELNKVVADLNAAHANFNPYKKRWYITPDQDLQMFQDICNQFSNENTKDTTQQMSKKEFSDFLAETEAEMAASLSKVPFQIEGIEIQYAVKMPNQQTVIIPESAINMWNVNGSMNEFFNRLNEKAVGRLQQISSGLEQIDPGQIAGESEYMISVDRDSHFNRCTVWFNDGREPVSLNGYVYGLDFLSMETDAVAEFVSEYLRQQDHLENGPSPSGYREGDWINCYVPLRLQDSSPNRPIYVENIRYISGTVQAVQPSMERDSSSNGVQEYTILDDIGSVQTIRSDEIYTPDQARVLLRAATDELTGVQFDLLADRRLSAAQMEEIRFGYKDGLSVEQVALYANPEMTPAEMDLCRIGLANGLEYAEISSLLKETKELSWTDSRNRLNEVIKEHREKIEERAENQSVKGAYEAALNEITTNPELGEVGKAEQIINLTEDYDRVSFTRDQKDIICNYAYQTKDIMETIALVQTMSEQIRVGDKEKLRETVAQASSPVKRSQPTPVEDELSEIQSHIVEHIQENFVEGTVSIEPVGDDKIRITDLTGESMNLAMSQSGGIIDADTNKIYGYAKDGYRPPAAPEQEAAQTDDFFGMKVPVENGMRVISSDEIFFGLSDRDHDNIEVLDFTNCIFRDVDFSQAFWDRNLSDANFSNSRFYDCKFDDVDLSRSSFQGAVLYDTRFRNAILKQCDFSKATISRGVFLASDVVETNFSKAIMKQINIEDCAMEENDFYMTHMDSVKISASCDITADQKNLDTVTYLNRGADPAEKDKVMWRLSGSEVTYERKEEMSRLFRDESNDPDAKEWREDLTYEERELVERWEKQRFTLSDALLEILENESNDPDTQEWREDLTYEERELVESWEKQRSTLSDVLLEKQHRQERYKERYNNMATQTEENQQDDVLVHICEDITKSGYKPTETLISNIQKLDAITGERHSLKDVVNLYWQNNFQNNQELSKAVLDIAEECKQQELARMPVPEANIPG